MICRWIPIRWTKWVVGIALFWGWGGSQLVAGRPHPTPARSKSPAQVKKKRSKPTRMFSSKSPRYRGLKKRWRKGHHKTNISWRRLQRGVMRAVIPLGTRSRYGDNQLHVVRVEPSQVVFRVLLAKRHGNRKRTTKQWANVISILQSP